MKTLRQSIFLPVFALIVFLGFGAGTALANSSNEGVGGWSSEAVGPGQVSIGVPGTLSGIDAPSTSHATGSEPKRRAFVGTLEGPIRATGEVTGTFAVTTPVPSITVSLQTSGGGSQFIGLPPAGEEVREVNVLADGTAECEICKFPGGPSRRGAFTENADVVVLVQQVGGTDEDPIWEAVWILVKPVKPPPTTTGLVVGVDGDEVTIETGKGDKKTVTLPEHARGLAHGEVITVFEGDEGKAKGLVRAEEVKNRLKGFLDDAEEGVADSDGDEDGKGKNHDKAAAHIARIDAFLERFNNRRTQLIDGVIDGAPQSVKEKLVLVKERIYEQRMAHRETIGRIWAKLDRAHPAHSHRGGSEAGLDNRPDNSDRGRPEGAGQARPDNADQNQGGERPSADDGSGRGRGRGQGGNTDTPTP